LSEPDPDYDLPLERRAGVWANATIVYRDPEHVTIDFVRLDTDDPRRGLVVARVTVPPSCILTLVNQLGGHA
jgi:hypothetical protein